VYGPFNCFYFVFETFFLFAKKKSESALPRRAVNAPFCRTITKVKSNPGFSTITNSLQTLLQFPPPYDRALIFKGIRKLFNFLLFLLSY